MRTLKHNLVLFALLTVLFALPAWASAATSGFCGADGDILRWVLDDNGTLTISGKGKMADFDYQTRPWGTTIKKVVMNEGITSIGQSAFNDFTNLTSVTIPNSVTHIGQTAFRRCTNLTSITIPDSVTSIGESAFNYCDNLNEVYCPSLEGWLKITFHDTFANPMFYADKLYINNKLLTSAVIPDGITSIGNYTFKGCSSLTSISIPNSVTSIGDNAFRGCSSLTSISIPDSVTSIGYDAFSDCTNLTSISIPNSVTNIGGDAFLGCSNLTSISIPDSVTSIGYGTFSACSSLTSISIPDSVTSIGHYAFSDCTNLTSISIPDSVTSIGDYAFSDCTNLTSISIPNSVTSISEWAFRGCSSLTSISIPDSVTSIGMYAFDECSSLSSIIFPDSVTSIGIWAFDDCDDLNEVYCSSLEGWLKITFDNDRANPMFYANKLYINNKLLTSAVIPDGITSIGNYTFQGCSSLTSISIPDSVTSIGDQAFSRCYGLTSIIIPGTTRPAYTLNIPTYFTVYCHEYSEVDYWALENGYNVSYLDNLTTPIEFRVTTPSTRMEKGTSQTLSIILVPEVTDPAITWSSSNPAIATVDNGVITAKAPGTVTITAAYGSATASVDLVVYAKAQAITFSPAELWVVSKEITQVQINALPAGADVSFELSGHDSTTITPTVSGNTINVLALHPGDTTFTVTDSVSGLSQTCTVHVVYPVTAVAFESSSVSVPLNGAAQLTANVTARDQTVTNQLVTFSSSDEAIATVDQQGLVTGLAKGTATITATATSGVSASCTVTVRDALTFTLPASLTTLGSEALMDTSAEVYVLPQGMTTISSRAFAGCSRLTRVIIPASVTSIAADAFEGCGSFVIVAPEGSTAHTFATENGISWVCE